MIPLEDVRKCGLESPGQFTSGPGETIQEVCSAVLKGCASFMHIFNDGCLSFPGVG